MLLNESFPPMIDGVANAVVNYARIIQGGSGTPSLRPSVSECHRRLSVSSSQYPSWILQNRWATGWATIHVAAMHEIEKFGADICHSMPIVSTLIARTLREKIDALSYLHITQNLTSIFLKPWNSDSCRRPPLRGLSPISPYAMKYG
jgi:hypothetical protein